MKILNSWVTFIVLYLVFEVLYNQNYKRATKDSRQNGALTVLLELIGGTTVLVLCPFMGFSFPTDYKIWIFLGLAIIFYAIAGRLNTNVMKGVEVSTYCILRQIPTVFTTIGGVLFFGEDFIATRFIGAGLIILSNVIIFFKKGDFSINKYLLIGLLANLLTSVGRMLDISISDHMSLPVYSSLVLLIPALLTWGAERIKLKDIISEYSNGNKKSILISGCVWGFMMVSLLKAYQLGQVTTVAPLAALSVLVNVVIGYIFLNERNNLLKKIISAVIIVVAIVLIKI
ncbi:MAG: EamA family transporter [Clostridia bacterium]|nr:EamA family transporter [Clostridia bacterium]